MKAYITSIGEPTTELCRWSLERNGFETIVIAGDSSLWHKLKLIYETTDTDFVRVDADVICNRILTPEFIKEELKFMRNAWWIQFMTFDWYKQDITHGGVQLIKSKALPALRDNIQKFSKAERPESQMFRLDEFHNPRRGATHYDNIMGIHGYGQHDLGRVKQTKKLRKQLDNYDWELVERLNSL